MLLCVHIAHLSNPSDISNIFHYIQQDVRVLFKWPQLKTIICHICYYFLITAQCREKKYQIVISFQSAKFGRKTKPPSHAQPWQLPSNPQPVQVWKCLVCLDICILGDNHHKDIWPRMPKISCNTKPQDILQLGKCSSRPVVWHQ